MRRCGKLSGCFSPLAGIKFVESSSFSGSVEVVAVVGFSPLAGIKFVES